MKKGILMITRCFLTLLTVCSVSFSAGQPSMPAESATVELRDGQPHRWHNVFRGCAAEWTLTYLGIGKQMFMNEPLRINSGRDWNVLARHTCAGISPGAPAGQRSYADFDYFVLKAIN